MKWTTLITLIVLFFLAPLSEDIKLTAQKKKKESSQDPPEFWVGSGKHVEFIWKDGWFFRVKIDDVEFVGYRSPQGDMLFPTTKPCLHLKEKKSK